MDRTWGSVVDGPTSAQNETTWHTVSLSTYKNYIRNGRTGAKQLNLPLIAVGGTNTDLVRRPPAGEDTTQIKFNERLFSKASIRVLLSDKVTDITNLPTVDNTVAPFSLEAGAPASVPFRSLFHLVRSRRRHRLLLQSPREQLETVDGRDTGISARFPRSSMHSPVRTPGDRYCTAKTVTTFTCKITTTAGGVNTIPVGATISAPGIVATLTTAASTPAGNGAGRTITVSNTMGFAQNTFWVDDQVVTCSGYTAASLTGCTVGTAIAGNATDTIQTSPR